MCNLYDEMPCSEEQGIYYESKCVRLKLKAKAASLHPQAVTPSL